MPRTIRAQTPTCEAWRRHALDDGSIAEATDPTRDYKPRHARLRHLRQQSHRRVPHHHHAQDYAHCSSPLDGGRVPVAAVAHRRSPRGQVTDVDERGCVPFVPPPPTNMAHLLTPGCQRRRSRPSPTRRLTAPTPRTCVPPPTREQTTASTRTSTSSSRSAAETRRRRAGASAPRWTRYTPRGAAPPPEQPRELTASQRDSTHANARVERCKCSGTRSPLLRARQRWRSRPRSISPPHSPPRSPRPPDATDSAGRQEQRVGRRAEDGG